MATPLGRTPAPPPRAAGRRAVAVARSWPSPACRRPRLGGARAGRAGDLGRGRRARRRPGHELEVVTEQFNEARETLDRAAGGRPGGRGASWSRRTAALATAQQQVRGHRPRPPGPARGSAPSRRCMTSDSADDFVDRMSTLQLVAGHQNGILEAAAGANVAAAQAQADRAGRRRAGAGDLRQGRRPAGRPAEAGRRVPGRLRPAQRAEEQAAAAAAHRPSRASRRRARAGRRQRPGRGQQPGRADRRRHRAWPSAASPTSGPRPARAPSTARA